ncbi:nicotinate-nucleotide adenylyltransferase [Schlesneria sp. T3-172]|uniref:nicotinate-nucleotide adenylyltransferase n=1 Tax=Schlesneria sphaerica TaxID=3373610 RepID=UPI0037C88C7F
MRLGIYGGTFDPIHYAHLVLAEQCREQCRLDEVWFVPAALPPHKLTSNISSARARFDMIELAIAGHPEFRISRIELDRVGPSFTVTTLEQLKSQDASRDLFLLIGADSLNDLPQWREPRRILELATVVAVNRGDRPLPGTQALRQAVGPIVDERVTFVSMPGSDLSSTEIRKRVREGQSIRYLVPRAVEMYIRENHLYEDSEKDASA